MKTICFYLTTLVCLLQACKKEEPAAPLQPLPNSSRGDTVIVKLSKDTSLCLAPNTVFRLDAPLDSVISYLWLPGGDSLSSKIVSQPASYKLVLYRFSGKDTLDIVVKECIAAATLFIPNSFSPNGDGHNDTWAPQGSEIASVYFEVRNQDGMVVFTSSSLGKAWDGKWKGTTTTGPVGFYMYYIEYISTTGELKKLRGNLELVL